MSDELYSAPASSDSEPSTLTMDESKEAAFWHERIGIAKKAQDQWADESGAKRFEKQYEGKFDLVFHMRNKRVPVPPINDVFAYVQADIATTYFRDPYFTVNAEAGTPQGAAFWEVQLNYWWRFLRTKEEIEYEILDKDLVGYAWHKVGYSASSIGSGEDLKLASECLYSKQLGWRDVVWNIGSKRPPVDCEWMAQRIVKPLQDVKAKYQAAASLEGSPNPEVDEDTFKKSSYRDDIKVGVLWEIWNRRTHEIILIAEGLEDRFLEPKKSWPEYQTEFPFLMYWDFAIPGKPRPMSAIAPWEAQNLEEMVLLASAMNHAKRWNRQAFVKNGTIDENSLDKYERGDDGAVIVYNGESADLKFADFGQLPTDFYLLMDRLQAIKRNVNGQPEFVRGGVTKTGTRTVGELQLMEQGTKGRQDRKIDRLETHCENIARHMMANLKGNFDLEQTIKISGETPQAVIEALGANYDPTSGTVRFTPAEIEGEYDVDVKAGSTLPMDKQHRTQILESILQSVAAVAGQGPMSPFLNALIQELLRNYEIKGLQEAYEQEQAQAQQAQALQAANKNIESQKTQAETAKREAQAQKISVDTEIQGQEAALGPIGRAAVEKAKKPEPKPVGAGAR